MPPPPVLPSTSVSVSVGYVKQHVDGERDGCTVRSHEWKYEGCKPDAMQRNRVGRKDVRRCGGLGLGAWGVGGGEERERKEVLVSAPSGNKMVKA